LAGKQGGPSGCNDCLGQNGFRKLNDFNGFIPLSYSTITNLVKSGKTEEFSKIPGIVFENEDALNYELKYCCFGQDNLHAIENIDDSLREKLEICYPEQISKIFAEEKMLMGRTNSMKQYSTVR
jgi:hypothetical protein